MKTKTDKKHTPVSPFTSPKKWETWLAKNHASSQGVWLQIYKKASEIKTVSYDQALDAALCYGWIDGQKHKYDEQSWLQKFTPRRPKSLWSQRNREHIARLIKEKRMKAAGLKQVELAKKDGRWDAAYASPSNATIPTDFLTALSKNKKAEMFFGTLSKTNLYSISWRLQTAKKPETRAKRMKAILEMLAKNEGFR